MCWFYPNWAQGDSVDHLIMSNIITGPSRGFTIEKFTDNSLYIGWINTTSYRVVVLTANYTLTQSAWNHFLFTWDDVANETKAYLNGSQIGSTVATLILPSQTDSVIIGNHPLGTGSLNADGRIAEVAFWNEILNPGDRQKLSNYVRPSQIKPGSLVNYWSLDPGNLSPEPDAGSGNNDGTVENATQADHPPMTNNPGGGGPPPQPPPPGAGGGGGSLLDSTGRRFRAESGEPRLLTAFQQWVLARRQGK